MNTPARDARTADAFASSWNNLPQGSVYTPDQHADWMDPLTEEDVRGKDVLELGCGNGSLLVHTGTWHPRRLVGVDLGTSVASARHNMADSTCSWEVQQADLTEYQSDGFDVVYCIGVLHHLKAPREGFAAVVRNVRPGGRFHCWVYGKEGNLVVRLVVEPIRRIACRLPWWVNKYFVATPLVVPYYVYAKLLRAASAALGASAAKLLGWLPLYEYSLWIAKRGFLFFRHVAFDQLVTPQTVFLSREDLASWLADVERLEPGSDYVIARNGNSWKFGGRLTEA